MRNAISIGLLLVLLVLTPVVVVLNVVQKNVLTTRFVKQEFVRLDLYGLAQQRIDESIDQIVIDPQYPITNADVVQLAHETFTPQWMQRTVEGVLDQVNIWLHEPKGAALSVLIDLRQPKQQLTTGIDELLTVKLQQLKPCSKSKTQEEQNFCVFAGMSLDELKAELKHQGLDPEVINTLLPDTLDVLNTDLSKLTGNKDANNPNGVDAKSAEIRQKLDDLKARYQQGVFLITWTLVILCLVFLLYLDVNASHGWHRLMRWGGAGLLAIGLFPLAFAIASRPFVDLLLQKAQFDGLPNDVASILPKLMTDLQAALVQPMWVIGIGCFVIGLAAMIGAHRAPNTEKK